jgi:TRAP-type mannitol/chloroaromatic compound transport system permease small subunit
MKLDYRYADAAFPRASAALRVLELSGFWLSTVAVTVLGTLAVTSIALRTLTGRAVPDDNIMIGDLVVAIVALSWAVVTATQGNIVVEVFTSWVAGRGQALLRILGSLVGLAMIIPLCWASGTMAYAAIAKLTYYDGLLHWPQWPSRSIFFISFVMMALRLILLIATDAVLAVTGRPVGENA